MSFGPICTCNIVKYLLLVLKFCNCNNYSSSSAIEHFIVDEDFLPIFLVIYIYIYIYIIYIYLSFSLCCAL